MLSGGAQTKDWLKWLSGPSTCPLSSRISEWDIVRDVCQEVVQLQFGKDLYYLYPPYDSPKSDGHIVH
jgi:hypothetical protein